MNLADRATDLLKTDSLNELYSPDSSYVLYSSADKVRSTENLLRVVVFEVGSGERIYSESLRNGTVLWESDSVLHTKETLGVAKPGSNGTARYEIYMKTGRKQLLNKVNNEEN